MSIADEGWAEPVTTIGAGRWALNLRLPGLDVAAVTLWHEKGGSLTIYRTVLERRAPAALARLEAGGQALSRTAPRPAPDDLLAGLRDAYQEAATSQSV